MSSGALRQAWEAAQSGGSSSLRAAWEAAQGGDVSEATKRIREEQRKGLLAGRIQRENANERDAVEAEQITPREAVGGTLANLIRDVPGGEFLTAGVHSLINRQSYPESFEAVRGAEESIPAAVRYPARAAGAIAAYGKIPGSASTKGALYGGLSGFSDADPEADRPTEVLTDAALGYTLGLGGELAGAAGSKAMQFFRKQLAREKGVARSILDAIRPSSAPASAPTTAPVSATPRPRMVVRPSPTNRPRINAQLPSTPSPIPVAPASPTAVASPPAAAPQASLDDLLNQLIAKARTSQPHELGNLYGDAEIAMGLVPKAEPTLEELLLRSLAARRP